MPPRSPTGLPHRRQSVLTDPATSARSGWETPPPTAAADDQPAAVADQWRPGAHDRSTKALRGEPSRGRQPDNNGRSRPHLLARSTATCSHTAAFAGRSCSRASRPRHRGRGPDAQRAVGASILLRADQRSGARRGIAVLRRESDADGGIRSTPTSGGRAARGDAPAITTGSDDAPVRRGHRLRQRGARPGDGLRSSRRVRFRRTTAT